MWMEAAAQQKNTEKSGKQRALQMPGASELCGLEERFVGLRGRGLAWGLSVHMDALNPFLSMSIMFGNKWEKTELWIIEQDCWERNKPQ